VQCIKASVESKAGERVFKLKDFNEVPMSSAVVPLPSLFVGSKPAGDETLTVGLFLMNLLTSAEATFNPEAMFNQSGMHLCTC